MINLGRYRIPEARIPHLPDLRGSNVHRHYFPDCGGSDDCDSLRHRGNRLYLVRIYRDGDRNPDKLQDHFLRQKRTGSSFPNCLQSWMLNGICSRFPRSS